jgi:hypothetical protein
MTRVVLLKPNSYEISTGETIGLDLSSYEDPDYISVTCPDFPSSTVLEDSFLELTSSQEGDFVSDVATVAFADALNSEEISSGDTELRFAISDFASIDLSRVTGLRFRVKTTSTTVFKVMAIRAISSDWVYAPIDLDTISQVVELPVSPDGDPDYEFEFPDAWPTVWQDIQPKDFAVSVEFFTGSATGNNAFTVSFRGGNVNEGIVNDLEDWNGTGNPVTMKELNEFRGANPPLGLRPELDLADEESATFEHFDATLSWGSNNSLIISKFEDELYAFEDISLEANSRYMAVLMSEKETFRVKVFSLDSDLRSISSEVFDSGLIRDPLFEARKGYFGWFAEITDGDSFVDNIRHRYANFGDLQTRQFRSVTPVAGVQLVHTSSPPTSLIGSAGAGPWGGIVSEPELESGAYQVISNGKMEGIVFTGPSAQDFLISDWKNTYIEFELFRAPGKYVCYLLGASGNIIELNIDSPITNEWEKFVFDFDGRSDPTGRYRLAILKVSSEVDTTWFIRGAKAETKTVHWVARNQEDPWNMVSEEWLPFSETDNKANSGIMFREPGYPQVKASITDNEAKISEFHVIPRYAQLGRVIIEEDPASLEHNISIETDINGLRVDFGVAFDFAEDDPRRPMSYIWIFDSSNNWYTGETARKVFRTPGKHHAFVQVTYNDGTVQSQYWEGDLAP